MKKGGLTAFLIVLGIFLGLEVLVRVLPIQYATMNEVFLTDLRKKHIHGDSPAADYVILGDSRSISLLGHGATEAEPYSMYNLSLPALGPRYFKYYFRTYLKNRKNKPRAVIFAGDPRQFQKSFYQPSHDPLGRYSDSDQDSLAKYLGLRFTRRIAYIFDGSPGGGGAGPGGPLGWDAYSHRYMHLFGLSDYMEQFTGAERVQVMRSGLPLLYRTYKYRDALNYLFFGFQTSFFKSTELPEFCSSCEGLDNPVCHPKRSRMEYNKFIEQGIKERSGMLNISDRLNPSQAMKAAMARGILIKSTKKIYEREEPDLLYLEDLIKDINSMGIKVILADVPRIKAYKGTKFYRLYNEQADELVKNYPLTMKLDFPEPWFPQGLFAEHVHFNCRGAVRLNADFFGKVMPQILKFAPVR